MTLKVINNTEKNKADCAGGCNAIPDGFVDTNSFGNIDEKIDFMRKRTTKMGYRFVGKHSAIKVCHWTKESIRGKNYCYKKKFYDIESSQCVQMTPVMFFCNFNCRFCWRNFDYLLPRKKEEWDLPEDVINSCIEAQKQFLQGFYGNPNIDQRSLMAAMRPKHFAISLSGEPTLYPHLPEFIDLLMKKKITAYLVTNGTNPEMLEKLTDHQPTNLYISLYGTTPEMYKKTAVPMVKDYWKKVMSSLSMMDKFDCNTVVRLTLLKGFNLTDPKGYADIIEKSNAKFIEAKGFMAVGGSRKSLGFEDMPLHEEIREFAAQIEKHSSYKIIDEKKDSRVVLMTR